MRKLIYYISPFVIIPLTMLICDCLADLPVIKQHMGQVIFIVLALVSAVTAGLSQCEGRFDYLITALMPLSLFVFMFLIAFLDTGETYSRFDLRFAFKTVSQPSALAMYMLLAVTAFVGSFKPVRIGKFISCK